VLITTQRDEPAAITLIDDYNALNETAYLLRNPVGAKRLLESVEQLRTGDGKERELLDDAS